jgi:hypothetical protein
MEIRKGSTGEAMTADASRQQTSQHFRSLYHSLVRARNLIVLICEILEFTKHSAPEDEAAIQGGQLGKRPRIDTQ